MDMTQVNKESVYKDIIGILDKLSEDWEYSEEITPDTYLIDDLGFESIDLVVLGTTIEKLYKEPLPFAQFFVEVGQREVRDICLGELVDFVFRNLNGMSGSSQ